MSYGFTATDSAATNTTSQPSQNPASGPEHTSKLNPDAPVFIPRAERVQPIDDHSNTFPTISGRQVTASETFAPRTFHQRKNIRCPEAIKEEIDNAYKALMNKKFIDAEAAFRLILDKNESILSRSEHQSVVIGLARSLKEQTYTKQKEACSRLEELRSKAPLNDFGASTIHNLDLTLSRCEEALGRYLDSEVRLKALRNIKPDADKETLCKPSGNFDADIANARLWQLMEKHTQSERLLLKMEEQLSSELKRSRSAAKKKRLRKHLHIVKLALARHWQVMNKYQLAEDLLLKMSDKHPGVSEETLCRPCKDHDVNLALARLWENMGKYQLTEKLLLNMSGKPPDASEDRLCKPCRQHDINMALAVFWELMGKPHLTEILLLNMSNKHPKASEYLLCQACGHYEIDITLARHWEHEGQYRLAERLLLSMCGKHPNNLEEILCKASGHSEIDLNLAFLWQNMGKYQLTEKLLLNMSGKHPDASEDILCKPSGHHAIDLTLVRYWEITDKHHLAEKLLLNMSGKHPDASEDILCKPCGYHDIDLALVHHWEKIDKRRLARRLIETCCELYHSKDCQFTLLIFSCGQPGFIEMISRYPENDNTLLATSIHYFNLAREQIINDDTESGKENLSLALETAESLLEKYPNSAGGLSQKAHCLRMMGADTQKWQKYFNKANFLDRSRTRRDKTNLWRSSEAAALQKLQGLKEQMDHKEL
ncbi:PABP-interacting PAM2 motif-containing protein [Endozoicomonas sp. 8E]|uniref:PABP-interacting PAM2 motif-containing protein n=1 Tax=Endozoicomonas sp. 8E TaxID=3035692 RepID=UPI00293941D3|nr:hypothetical protein [Endozoicomonas sp. 8E]WOG26250.1 hypothetical protein P6910_16990 [Endozoicomonas sp. 8E]